MPSHLSTLRSVTNKIYTIKNINFYLNFHTRHTREYFINYNSSVISMILCHFMSQDDDSALRIRQEPAGILAFPVNSCRFRRISRRKRPEKSGKWKQCSFGKPKTGSFQIHCPGITAERDRIPGRNSTGNSTYPARNSPYPDGISLVINGIRQPYEGPDSVGFFR
jgi:hypothetical protein